MTKGRGNKTTPPRVVELVKKAVSEMSLRQVSKGTGLGIAAISRYSQGIGEPSQATLEKLSDYFGVSVSYLRGGRAQDELEENILDFTADDFKINATRFTNESILEFIAGKKKYSKLWEVFSSMPDSERKEAFKFLEGYSNLSIAAFNILKEKNEL